MKTNFKVNSLEDLDNILYDFKIVFAYHSNKIENEKIDYHDTRDIFEKGTVTGYSGDLRTLYEIANQANCYQFLKAHIINGDSLNIEFIKKIHYKLTKGTYDEIRYNIKNERPGEFKKHDYVTGIYDIGSSPEDVVSDLSELLSEVNKFTGEDHFTAGVYFHAMFESIHPFADGNGRIGRTLMNYYFMIHEIAPVVIFNEDKKFYYQALEKFDLEGDLDPLKKFIEYEQEKTWSPKKKKENISLSHYQNKDDDKESFDI